jgi:hypothetical protein
MLHPGALTHFDAGVGEAFHAAKTHTGPCAKILERFHRNSQTDNENGSREKASVNQESLA